MKIYFCCVFIIKISLDLSLLLLCKAKKDSPATFMTLSGLQECSLIFAIKSSMRNITTFLTKVQASIIKPHSFDFLTLLHQLELNRLPDGRIWLLFPSQFPLHGKHLQKSWPQDCVHMSFSDCLSLSFVVPSVTLELPGL